MRFIIALFLFLSLSVSGQFVKSNHQWFQMYSQVSFVEKWSIVSDGGFRWQNTFNTKSSYIIRTGFAYDINSSFRFSMAFANAGYYLSDSLKRMEYRPHQELTYRKKFKHFTLDQRVRVEQRFFGAYRYAGSDIPSSNNWRFRYQAQMNIPLLRFAGADSSRSISLTLADEIFFAAGKNITNAFNLNRFLIGPNFNVNKKLTISLIYNAQIAPLGSNDNYSYSSIFWFTVRHKMICRKSKS